MDHSTWLSCSLSLDDISLGCGGDGGGDNGGGGDNTLRLLDDLPVKDCVNKVHVLPTNSSRLATTPLLKHEVGTLMEELNRVNTENKNLTEKLRLVCKEYDDLKRKLMSYVGKSYSDEVVDNATKRRKVANISNNNDANVVKNNNGECSSSDEEDSSQKPLNDETTLKTKITKVAVRTHASDSTLVLKDGYIWRKYGQKVTKDNPCPRAYFRCSFAPSCPVKKKVQRSQEDQSILVATYEGEHNHQPPPNQGTSPPSSGGFTLISTQYNNDNNNNNTMLGSLCPNITLDLTKSKAYDNVPYDTTKSSSSNVSTITTLPSNNLTKINSQEFHKLAQQMSLSLMNDPNFTAALAAAISGRFGRQ